ncbi:MULTISPECIES: BREX-1 system adenine-specific DNA-methyltransferase PglX [Lactococcus]|uniref:BREX-1 system adenine-specific DNA-methyltransferase PglX n=1 Tax=Lactococcus TaxID=1357 RepID=UPI0024A77E80|nr:MULTISPECIES: BREX-1 system adenine-specific DNA-methyltransferase PglX [Lactococcus]MDT2868572.1 BREX-1 system adenine-specific DNA-methyltransferase PglX [Lactococcus lactis]
MDKKAIKNFAIEARKSLISGVSTKLSKLGITENGIEEATRIDNDLIEIQSTGARFSGKEVASRAKLVTEFQKREIQGQKYELAFETLIEEVAYTWFNRIIAIRFMEVNDYLPDRLRVLSSETSGKKEPDVITALLDTGLYEALDHESKERVTELLTDGSADAVDELYQLVFIKQCNSLNAQLPDLFERIEDYTELLITISYIDENGVIASLLTIPESDFDVRQEGQIEIIGWMYQYYNTEPKDKVFARGSRKIRADEIPAATQLFTPDWIVRYMVENSLGRYYIDQKLANPLEERSEKEIADAFGWKYYLPTAGQPEDVQLQIQDERKKKSVFALQELKLIDPSMGSGHILVYAFDVLMQLYEAEGETPRIAAKLILEKNLFGLDIDKRAFQLSYFALMMKGRQYNRRILNKEIKPKVYAIPTHEMLSEEELQLLNFPFRDTEKANQDLITLSERFSSGNDLGSLIEFKGINFDNLKAGVEAESAVSFLDQALHEMIEVGELLQQKYAVVVTNPPYMGSSGFNATLAKFAKKAYPNSKSDLFAMFIERWNKPLLSGAYNAMVTMQSWMFLSSYETMRKNIINQLTIANMMHMENMVMGIAFGTAVTIFQNKRIKEFKGTYHQIRTVDASKGTPESVPVPGNRFNQISQDEFNKIPGSPISYWVSENLIKIFENKSISEFADARLGMATADNNRFLRLWHEINIGDTSISSPSRSEAINSRKKWFPYDKGGSFRRWYGNNEYLVNWKNDGYEIQNFKDNKGKVRSHNYNLDYIFKDGITWSALSSGKFSCRYSAHSLFDNAGSKVFANNNDNINYILGILNSPLTNEVFKLINPTMNYQPGTIAAMIMNLNKQSIINEKVQTLINQSKSDWDSFEESWDFKKHPLI